MKFSLAAHTIVLRPLATKNTHNQKREGVPDSFLFGQ
jgi:hypothetical protein